MDIEIQWIDELIAKLWNMNVKKALDTGIKKSIFLIERTAKQRTPVDTWLLRNSYESKFQDLEWTLRNFREYWPIVEARVGFMESTLFDEERNIENIFDTEINNLIRSLE